MKTKKHLAVIVTLAMIAGLFSMTTPTSSAFTPYILVPVVNTAGDDAIEPSADIKAMFGGLGVWGVRNTTKYANFKPTPNADNIVNATGLNFWVYIPTNSYSDRITIVFGLNGGSSSDWGNDWYYKVVNVTKGSLQIISVPFADIKNNYGGGTGITAAQASTSSFELRVCSYALDLTGFFEGYFSDFYDIGMFPGGDPPITTTIATTSLTTTTSDTTTAMTTNNIPPPVIKGEVKIINSGTIYKPCIETISCTFYDYANGSFVHGDGWLMFGSDIQDYSLQNIEKLSVIPFNEPYEIFIDEKGQNIRYSMFEKDGKNIYSYSKNLIMPEITGEYILGIAVTWRNGVITGSFLENLYYEDMHFFAVKYDSGSITTNDKPEKGDINNDGKVNGIDLLLTKQHILNIPDKEIEEGTSAFYAADMNDDGKINGMDLLLLKKKILS